MARTARPKEIRECDLHGEAPHALTLHARRDGKPDVQVWKCMVCDNERARVRAWNRRRTLKADTRPGGMRPMAWIKPGAVRPANQTLPPEALAS